MFRQQRPRRSNNYMTQMFCWCQPRQQSTFTQTPSWGDGPCTHKHHTKHDFSSTQPGIAYIPSNSHAHSLLPHFSQPQRLLFSFLTFSAALFQQFQKRISVGQWVFHSDVLLVLLSTWSSASPTWSSSSPSSCLHLPLHCLQPTWLSAPEPPPPTSSLCLLFFALSSELHWLSPDSHTAQALFLLVGFLSKTFWLSKLRGGSHVPSVERSPSAQSVFLGWSCWTRPTLLWSFHAQTILKAGGEHLSAASVVLAPGYQHPANLDLPANLWPSPTRCGLPHSPQTQLQQRADDFFCCTRLPGKCHWRSHCGRHLWYPHTTLCAQDLLLRRGCLTIHGNALNYF